ncbi:MAG: cytidine deaminase [Armatimonadota bacterium]
MITAGEFDELIQSAKSALENAYAPYSEFRVGAAVLFESGKIYCGCNVENASYGLSNCAERTAIFNAVCSGDRDIRAIAIASSTGDAAYPCGACRQVIAEFARKDEDISIYIVSNQGVEKFTLAELLPNAFKL